jgi:transglutaminase-like putative cysteine protease
MRLGLAHESGLLLTTVCALLIVLLGGEFPLAFWSVLGAPFLATWMRVRGQAAPASSGSLLGLASIAWGVSQIFVRGAESAVLAGGMTLIGILVARLLTRQTLRHDLQVIALSMLLVMAGSVLNVGMTFAICFFLYAISVIWALTTRQLLVGAENSADGNLENVKTSAARARQDVVTVTFFGVTGLVAVAILLSTTIIFIAFPRVGSGNLGLPSGEMGLFPPSVSLHGQPRASVGTGEVVARIKGLTKESFSRGLYLRGAIYEEIGAHGFAQLNPPPLLRKTNLDLSQSPELATYDIYLQPIAGELLFSLGPVRKAKSISGGYPNPGYRLGISGTSARGELWAAAPLAGAFRYQIQGGLAYPGYVPVASTRRIPITLPPTQAASFLEIPVDMDARVKELAMGVIGTETDPQQKALLLHQYMRENFKYTLAQPAGASEDPLWAFLFDVKAGHCEYFAAAYGMLLRVVGIPSRIVGGYQGGAWDESSQIAVFTGKNAHAWVEWLHPNHGWITDDPTPVVTITPPSLTGWSAYLERIRRFWDDDVLDYELRDQVRMLEKGEDFISQFSLPEESGAFWAALGLFGLFIGTLLLFARYMRQKTWRQDSYHPLANALIRYYHQETGQDLYSSQTFRTAFLSESAHFVSREKLEEIVHMYEDIRFGRKCIPSIDVQKACAELDRLSAIESKTGSAALDVESRP